MTGPRADDNRTTIDLRVTRPAEHDGPVIDLRDTVLVPQQARPPAPAALPSEPVEILRFGPGVPAVIATIATPIVEPPRRLRRNRALNMALTLALAAVVVWLLWPAGALRVRTVSVSAPPLVHCEKSADVVATVRTNGNAGQLKYRWSRNDGGGSGTLVQSVARGQHSVNLHLTWAFHGPGSFAARATVQLISLSTASETVNFSYVC